ncbi:hypothetical protein ACFY5K_25875 [Streptomyces griseofuscus]|uniref:hypothetical protein n=1 Tax=Streptomyces griseofuscus TaxID=146922 RepID=UPI00369869B6
MSDEAGEGAFGDLVKGLEEELNGRALETQGTYAIAAARITGGVYVEAVAAGVPGDLAKEMATDSWMKFMGITAPQEVQITPEDEG